MELDGKCVVVTGSGQGLGQAMAVHFASQGANLALVDMNEEGLSETATLCCDAGGNAQFYCCNVADESSVTDTFAKINQDAGTVHGLVNNAGILRDGLLVKAKDGEITKRMTLDEWQAVIDVNLTGVFLCGREAATHMIQNKTPGVIINIASISRAGNMGQSNYSAAKSGVTALAVTWAKELSRYSIRVAAIAPGFIETKMTGSMKPEALDKIKAGIPLKRMGQPDEIARTASYIFENDYFTGRVIECDGGLRL